MKMNNLTIPVALAVLVMVLVAIFLFARPEKVLVFGESIDARSLHVGSVRLRGYAGLVQADLALVQIDEMLANPSASANGADPREVCRLCE